MFIYDKCELLLHVLVEIMCSFTTASKDGVNRLPGNTLGQQITSLNIEALYALAIYILFTFILHAFKT
jgi:hypothetical protein